MMYHCDYLNCRRSYDTHRGLKIHKTRTHETKSVKGADSVGCSGGSSYEGSSIKIDLFSTPAHTVATDSGCYAGGGSGAPLPLALLTGEQIEMEVDLDNDAEVTAIFGEAMQSMKHWHCRATPAHQTLLSSSALSASSYVVAPVPIFPFCESCNKRHPRTKAYAATTVNRNGVAYTGRHEVLKPGRFCYTPEDVLLSRAIPDDELFIPVGLTRGDLGDHDRRYISEASRLMRRATACVVTDGQQEPQHKQQQQMQAFDDQARAFHTLPGNPFQLFYFDYLLGKYAYRLTDSDNILAGARKWDVSHTARTMFHDHLEEILNRWADASPGFAFSLSFFMVCVALEPVPGCGNVGSIRTPQFIRVKNRDMVKAMLHVCYEQLYHNQKMRMTRGQTPCTWSSVVAYKGVELHIGKFVADECLQYICL
jgi:hypothetical protein